MSGQTVIIKKGDSLDSISKRYGVPVPVLKFTNKIKDARTIKPGQVLTIPVIYHASQEGVSAGLDSVHFSKKPIISEITNYTTAQIKDKIRAEAKNQGVDENLALAVVEQESQFKPNAKSPTGAVGLFQLTKIAAKQVKGKKTYDVDKNINYGTKYLKWCLDNTKTDEEALVSYNAGIGAMKKAKKDGIPIDSITDKKNGKGYAENVLNIYERNKKG